MKTTDYKKLYNEIFNIMGDLTPLTVDCGVLCDAWNLILDGNFKLVDTEEFYDSIEENGRILLGVKGKLNKDFLLESTDSLIEKRDIIYYSAIIVIISGIAYIVNLKFGSNLMFISENFPGTFIEIMYNTTGGFFTTTMILAQMFLPFYFMYGIIKLIKNKENKEEKLC